MPYEGEFAKYGPLRRLVESERVNQLLGSYKIRNISDRLESLQSLNPIQLQPGDWTPNYLIAIDGSHAEVDIKNGFSWC